MSDQSEQLLQRLMTQTSDSIQSLYKLTTQIDERTLQLRERNDEIVRRIDNIATAHNSTLQRLAVLESKNHEGLQRNIDECEKRLSDMDKRVSFVETNNTRSEGRWKSILNIAVQILILVVASWILLKMNIPTMPTP